MILPGETEAVSCIHLPPTLAPYSPSKSTRLPTFFRSDLAPLLTSSRDSY